MFFFIVDVDLKYNVLMFLKEVGCHFCLAFYLDYEIKLIKLLKLYIIFMKTKVLINFNWVNVGFKPFIIAKLNMLILLLFTVNQHVKQHVTINVQSEPYRT